MAADASQPPSQTEYASIRDALMSTARGRWFLDEYARANRHTDTRTVLDAVERLERAVAAQVLQPADPVPAAVEASEAMSRSLLRDRFKALMGALAAREEAIGPLERATHKFQAVIWTLREGGADLRLCDLLEAQVNAIGEANRTLANADAAIISVMESLCSEFGLIGDAPVDAAVAPSIEATIASIPEKVLAAVVPEPIAAPADVAVETQPITATPPAAGSSLGDAVLASGLLRAAPADPLAALARMTQAEKIAFFT